MSVKASQRELMQLIYSHLKEHGFSSAAEELHRHSPQGELKLSASLQDIYSVWLKKSKKKKQSPSAKKSKSRDGTSTKVKKSPKKTDKPPKKPKTKKASPKKKKTSEGKSKTQDAVKDAADSDSDSSLDVEKWKNLLLTMTEADREKMDSINALDCTKPEPKKRVRKPRPKPGAKTVTPSEERATMKGAPKKTSVTCDASGAKKSDKSAEDKPTNSAISASEQKTATVNEEAACETTSEPKKKKKKKEKGAGDVEVEEIANGASKDGKEKDNKEKKKRKIQVTEECADVAVGKKKKIKGCKGDDEKKGTEENKSGGVDDDASDPVAKKKAKKRKTEKSDKDKNPSQIEEEVKKRRKSLDGEGVSEKTELNEKVFGSEEALEDKAEEKKEKKKKKKRINVEENPEEVQKNPEPQDNPEQMAMNNKCEDVEPRPEQKKGKKKKKRADGEKNSEPEASAEEENSERKTKENTLDEEKSHPVESVESPQAEVREKKAKKKKKRESRAQVVGENNVDQNGSFCEKVSEETLITESSLRDEEPVQTPAATKKKKKAVNLFYLDTLLPSVQETPDAVKLKRKSIVKSAEMPEVSLQCPPATPKAASSHKKKKKSCEDLNS